MAHVGGGKKEVKQNESLKREQKESEKMRERLKINANSLLCSLSLKRGVPNETRAGFSYSVRRRSKQGARRRS